jgi:hypothetical protein
MLRLSDDRIYSTDACALANGRSLGSENTRSQEGTFNNCARDSLFVHTISLSPRQVNCIAIVINAYI